jgi:alcohol dehydrogenase class IV
MAMNAFQFAATPVIHFGGSGLKNLANALPQGTRRVLVVTGSFPRTNRERWNQMVSSFEAGNIQYELVHIHNEPTAEWVDGIVDRHRAGQYDAVVAIGGGSVLDAGKAISAMLLTAPDDTILHYLEGMPAYRPHNGSKVFFAAVPTTAGTGSEMTKNAVITATGGAKRSIRHDRFIPDVAIVDGALIMSCPLSVKAASGLDALTQLIESYVSTKASPLTDALALSGIEAAAKSLLPICAYAAEDPDLHAQMAYASMLSGITLANAGLGLVHGLAAPLGGMFAIPHGVVCGTLLAEATKRNIASLRESASSAHPLERARESLAKYAKVGAILTGSSDSDLCGNCDRLVRTLEEWTERLQIPRLGPYGVNAANLDAVIAAANNKQSPIELEPAVMREIVVARI